MSHRKLILAAWVVSLLSCDTRAEESAMELFEQRIMPIFRSSKPSSCVQCHLASVDLKNYILPSHEQTFLSLRDQGLIDTANPSDSKILKLIRMGDSDRDEMAKRIHAKTRHKELEAFAAWIRACCEDKALLGQPKLSAAAVAGPAVSNEVIRHGRKDRVLDSFVRNVWSQRMRCFPCHTPDEIDQSNPMHVKPAERHREFVQRYGARMNIFKATPEQTMRSLLAGSHKASSKQLPMINLDEPAQSLLVLKPTSKLPPKDDNGKLGKPSSLSPVSHMGGLKMHVDDVSYKAVVAWIQDVADIEHERYASADDIPPDNWYPSQHVIRIKDVPESWPLLGRVQLVVHAHDDQGPMQAPLAFTQGLITPRRFANGSLMVLRSPQHEDDFDWDAAGVSLRPGRYTVKVYLDEDRRIESDPQAMLSEEEFRGQLTFTADWGQGFKNAELISAKELSAKERSK